MTFEHADGMIETGQEIVIVDDCLVSGSTAVAHCELAPTTGCGVVEFDAMGRNSLCHLRKKIPMMGKYRCAMLLEVFMYRVPYFKFYGVHARLTDHSSEFSR